MIYLDKYIKNNTMGNKYLVEYTKCYSRFSKCVLFDGIIAILQREHFFKECVP